MIVRLNYSYSGVPGRGGAFFDKLKWAWGQLHHWGPECKLQHQ